MEGPDADAVGSAKASAKVRSTTGASTTSMAREDPSPNAAGEEDSATTVSTATTGSATPDEEPDVSGGSPVVVTKEGSSVDEELATISDSVVKPSDRVDLAASIKLLTKSRLLPEKE
jgi:hypothetical protein